MPLQIYIGKNIKRLREKRGLTQVQLANKIGSTQPAIARLEAGKHNTKLDYLAKIAKALGLKLYPPELK